jgi:hypothetical protein
MVLSGAMSGSWSYPVPNPDPERQRGRGQEMVCSSCVALGDHGDRFGQAISRVCTINMCASQGRTSRTTNSGMEATHNNQDVQSLPLFHGNQGERG